MNLFTVQRKKGVSLPTLHGYTLLNTAAPGEVDIDDATGSSEAIIKVNRRQSLHQQQITALLQLVCAELGSDLDFVRLPFPFAY